MRRHAVEDHGDIDHRRRSPGSRTRRNRHADAGMREGRHVRHRSRSSRRPAARHGERGVAVGLGRWGDGHRAEPTARRDARPGRAVATPAPRPRRRGLGGSPADVLIRWFCCLGTGDEPEQVAVERQVVEAFNAATAASRSRSRGCPTPGRVTPWRPRSLPATRPTSSARWASVAPNAFDGQWLDLQPLIDKTGYRHQPVPASRRSTCTTSAARASSASRSPSIRPCCSTSAACSRRPASPSRRTSTAANTRCPTASVVAVGLRHGRASSAMLLTVDKNGKDATEAGFDPENIVQWGFEPQRDDLRRLGAYWTAGQLVARRRQDRPDPRRLGGGLALPL